METSGSRAKTVRIDVYVPAEVREWVDRKSLGVYKSRGRYVGDLLIAMYNKDHQQQVTYNPVNSSSTPVSPA